MCDVLVRVCTCVCVHGEYRLTFLWHPISTVGVKRSEKAYTHIPLGDRIPSKYWANNNHLLGGGPAHCVWHMFEKREG